MCRDEHKNHLRRRKEPGLQRFAKMLNLSSVGRSESFTYLSRLRLL
jgi:hypothetical protein